MKKKISFVTPNFRQGPEEFNAYYLPYSAAVIWSYANQFDYVKEHYELGDFIWRRDPVDNVVELLKDCAVVGFSTYIWNRNYNNIVAKKLREANPDVLIVFGGPEPPIDKPNFFKKFPYINICVKQEGEISFKKILEATHASEYINIPGLLVNDNGNTIDTGISERIGELDTIPSPYLTGVFDKIMSCHPEITWNATLETNRGCPYACTFCDWGSLTYNKIKKFEMARVFDELEWIGQHRCDFLSITDANFGIFPERDSLIADKLISIQQRYGTPTNYSISWAKNQKREIVDIVKKLIAEGGAKSGLNLSVQTLDENTLEIIKRKNLETNKIEEVFSLCEENNIPLFTELILGLPGQTADSWKKDFYKLYEIGNHTGIAVYQAQILENAEMNLLQRSLYKIKGIFVLDYIIGSHNENEIQESIEVVTSTKDIPPDAMLDSQVFGWYMNTFHINGISNYLSRFLFKYEKVGYETFYEKMFAYISNDSWLKSEIDRIRFYYSQWAKNGKIDHPLIQGISINGFNLNHSTIIKMHSDGYRQHVFDVIKQFAISEFNIDRNILNQLMMLQENFLVDQKLLHEYPKSIKFDYDFLGYIHSDLPLDNPTEITFNFLDDKGMSIQRFCENLHFGRRRNFGKAHIFKSQ